MATAPLTQSGAAEGERKPSIKAATKNSADALVCLLKGGANKEVQDEKSWTALHHAASLNHPACIKILLQHQANCNSKSKNGLTPLMLTAQRGNAEAMDCLLKGGAEKEQRDYSGFTALHHASFFNYPACIKILLQHKANINSKAKDGKTPLMMAKKEGNDMAYNCLLEAGAESDSCVIA